MAAVAAVGQSEGHGQLGLYESRAHRRVSDARRAAPVCAGCRAKEARYGFRDDESGERPRTLCFECFRMELEFRRRVAAQIARGWNAEQRPLPLAETLHELTTRRRRAQIAARHAIGA
jgi:hypothetical protein